MILKGVWMCLASHGFKAEVCTIAILGETGLGKVSVPIMSLGRLERTAGRCKQLAPPGSLEIKSTKHGPGYAIL